MDKKISTLLAFAVIIILAILVAASTYFYYQNLNNFFINMWPFKTNKIKSVSLDHAEEIAKKFFQENLTNNATDYVIDQGKTYKGNFGYVFFFESKEYLITGDVRKLVPGPSGVVVENSQKVYFLSSSVTPEMAIKELEKTLVSGEQENITLEIRPRGDFVDPGPIENECQKRMEEYINGKEFKSKMFSTCELIDSKIGKTDKECPNGLSPTGCSICKISCK